MKKWLFRLTCPVLLFFSCNQRTDEPFSFEKIYYYAIQEDVRKIVESINEFDEDSLTEEQKELRSKYNSRFLQHTEKFNFATGDSLLISILEHFHNYWDEILMKKTSVRSADEKYRKIMTGLLLSVSNPGSQNGIQHDFVNALRNLMKEKGYYTRIDNTGNIMDLIAWTSQVVKTYEVNISDSVLKVPVVLIDSVLTYGWEGYATFDHFYPGGWTSPDTLFCITKDYDLESEKFSVSYLTHESQHLYDSKTYSNYPNYIAEYRAKLAELAVADSTIYDLLGAFLKGYKRDPALAHPYAEYMLIKGLSGIIMKDDFVTNINAWKEVSKTEINIASKQLLKENSMSLKRKN